MGKLGTVLGTSPQHLIIRTHEGMDSSNLPKIGEDAYNLKKEKIGKIFDIFGPVSKKPFISVKLGGKFSLDDFENERGSPIYTFKKKSLKKRKYRKRGRSPRKPKRNRKHHNH